MAINHTVDSWTQEHLRVLAKDDMSLAYVAGGIVDDVPDYSAQRWQLAVDMIYRCIVSGLLELTYPKYRVDHDGFFYAIRTLSPFDRSDDVPFDESGGVLWNWEQLRGTDTLVDLINKHFPDRGGAYDGTVNPAFIEELRSTFASAGVPWSDATLLPVTTKSRSDGRSPA
jgi:hypothetical protein